MDKILEWQGVCRDFSMRRGVFDPRTIRVKAVDGVTLSLHHGETLGLVGESGCGKSTLARMTMGLLTPTSGEIRLDARPLLSWTARERARRIQMVFQDPFSSLDPRQTVGSSIGEPLRIAAAAEGKTLSRIEVQEKIADLLLQVGLLPEYGARYPHEFSGGQRQRVAVARALAPRPAALVCDEPVSALDASVQAQVLNLLKEVQEKNGLSFLFISHDLGVIDFMSDRVAVMYLGKIVELGSRDDIFAHAAHPYTQALLDAAPSRERQRVKSLLTGEIPSPLFPPQGCAFHPRCHRARALCRKTPPPEIFLSDQRLVRCHFPL